MSKERTGAVVVTGASTGIGRATALRLAQSGQTVFAGVRKPQDGERLEAEASGELRPLQIDVTDGGQVAAAAAAVSEAVGERGIIGLVNNAGVAIGGPVEFVPLDDLRRQLEINLVGQVAVIQAFMSQLRRATGRVVNVASVGGRVASPFFGPYNASKFGLKAISGSLRMELRPWGIGVSVIEPGAVATEIWERGASTAREVRERMPAEAETHYAESLDAATAAANKMGEAGIHPDRVAKAIEHALTARRPKKRYLIGREARMMVGLSTLLPRGAYDALVQRGMGLPREPPNQS